MATTRANMSNLLNPAIRAISFLEYNAWPSEYDQIFNMEDTDLQEVKESSLTGFGAVPRKYEGQSIVYDNPIQGYIYTVSQLTWGMGFRVTLEMMTFDLFNKMRKMAKALTRSSRQTTETTAFNILNRGFNASYLGADGVTLFSTAHPKLGGGTQRNRPSVDADLSFSGIKGMLLDFHTFVDDKGIPMVIPGPITIWAHPTKETILDELLLSPNKPYTADNEVNSLAKKGLQSKLGHWLSNTGYWYGLAPKDYHSLKGLWALEPEMEHGTDFDTKDLKWSIHFMNNFGWFGYLGTWGSAGS